jgi:uncharacterized protein (DUF433 family)
MSMMNFQDIIRIDSGKRFGKPCVRDTRITVYDVLGWLSAGMSYDEIIADFPELTQQDILACLAFAAQREHSLQYA